MKYSVLLESLQNQIVTLSGSHQISIPSDSWINQAISIVKRIIEAINIGLPESKYFSTEALLYEKTVSSLQQLYDLSTILTVVAKLTPDLVITKKLNSVFSAPLLMMDEKIIYQYGFI